MKGMTQPVARRATSNTRTMKRTPKRRSQGGGGHGPVDELLKIEKHVDDGGHSEQGQEYIVPGDAVFGLPRRGENQKA